MVVGELVVLVFNSLFLKYGTRCYPVSRIFPRLFQASALFDEVHQKRNVELHYSKF